MRRAVAGAVIMAGCAMLAGCGGRPAASASPRSGSSASASSPNAKHYEIIGQILVVTPDKQTISIKHQDIVGYMPAMTMTFPVATPELMKDRVPGETITATLEVDDAMARITEITHTGNEPLPDRTNASSLAAGVLEQGADAPDAALIDQNNKRRSFSEWKGQPTLLTFIYTRCPLPNFCPLMDRNFVTIQRAGAADPKLAGKFKLVSVSFDPEFDTPAVLKAHAKTLGADESRWTFLTGDRSTVDRFAAKFGVGVIREGPGDITHNLRTVLMGADGKLLMIYPGTDWSTTTVLNDLHEAVARAAKQ
jgi:protein SCO1/2